MTTPQPEKQPICDVNNIEVVYNDIIQVLRGVSLNVPENQIVALLGTNGAGKTTTLRAISGLLKPENGFIKEGHVTFKGQDITNVLGTEVVKIGAVMVPEGRRVFKHLTVEENIRVGSITRKESSAEINAEMDKMYTLFPRLRNVTNRLAGYCSGGEQQMIAIGRALMAAPDMLMLDEPSLGLAPLLVEEIFEKVKEINQSLGHHDFSGGAKCEDRSQHFQLRLYHGVGQNSFGRRVAGVKRKSGCERVLHGADQGW